MAGDKTEVYGWVGATPHTDAYLADKMLQLLKNCGAQSVLDAGCGNGALANRLTQAGYDVVGIDGDEGGIAIARSNYPDVSFSVDLFENEPSSIFDAVVSTEVIEHL